MAVNQSVEILMTRQLCLFRHSDAAPLRASWNGKVFNATVWRGKVATIPVHAQTHALPPPCFCLRHSGLRATTRPSLMRG